MPSLVLAALTLAFAVLSIASGATSAQTLDPHVLYEERCAGCHAPHAGEFVPDNLARRGDQIVGRDSGKELRPFLAGGHGRLEPLEVDVMVAHLAAILEAGGLFREQCLICHDRAVVLARRELVLRGNRLVGRYSGRDIPVFLENHGRLNDSEIAIVLRMLERQLAIRPAE
jgi:cytochrome c5